jgi:UDP-glucose 6-dehydrogenase
MKITIASTGYVGLSNAMLLSQNHEVIALDIISEKIEQLNNKIFPIVDAEIEDFLANKDLNFTTPLDKESAYRMLTLSSSPHRLITTLLIITLILSGYTRDLFNND